MQTQTRRIEGSDGISLHLSTWTPEDLSNVRGVIQLLHGQGEYSDRYRHMGEYLTGKGFIVYADDHRGHGLTVFEQPKGAREEHCIPGHMADEDGWQKAMADQGIIHRLIRDKYPDKHLTIIGHSMGSFMLQDLLIEDSSRWDAAVLLGSAGGAVSFDQRILRQIIRLQYAVKGGRAPATWTDYLIMQSFSREVKVEKYHSEWLSHDPEVYIPADSDPLMDFMVSARHWLDFSKFVVSRTNPKNIAKVRNDLPIWIASGTADPISKKGAATEALAMSYKEAGLTDVTKKLYEGMRHELQNEIIKEQFFDDLHDWLSARVPA